MGRKKRHHVVSKGHQRRWADERGHVLLRSIDGTFEKPVSITDAFVESHFNSFVAGGGERIADLEDEWSRVESGILPAVRALGDGDEAALSRDAVRVLGAIHFGRSYSFDVMRRRVHENARAQLTADAATNPETLRVFRRIEGRDPAPGELETIALEQYEMLERDGAFRLERMVSTYDKTLARLRELHVQLVRHPCRRRVPSVPFITGDTPIVHFAGRRTGHRSRLAIFEADHIWFPLAPNLAVMFTSTDEGDQTIPTITAVQHLSRRIWSASWRFVAGHPSTNMARALAL